MQIGLTGAVGNSLLAAGNGQNAKSASQSLRDQFMTILLTQLKYQDPMEPMKEKDFFAQMAQFTTASETQSMNKNFLLWMDSFGAFLKGQSLLMTAGLIGKSFTANVNGDTIQGIVESCAISDGKIVVRWSGKEIALDDLTSIGGNLSGNTNA